MEGSRSIQADDLRLVVRSERRDSQTSGSIWQSMLLDLIPTNLTCILPNFFQWYYRSLISHDPHRRITCYKLQNTVDKTSKVGYMYLHGGISKDVNRVILNLPGDHAHPASMSHLADIAKSKQWIVFSAHLPYDDAQPEQHRTLLKAAVSKIIELVQEKNEAVGDFFLVGHSRGGMEGAYEAYVEENEAITGVISIAGRLQVIEGSKRPCRKALQASVNAVYEKIIHPESLRSPLYEIAATDDWCIDYWASAVRRDHFIVVDGASHLNILFHPKATRQFAEWIA